ncbi:MAG: AMP-binding protein, partial [Bacteroidota bacterium]
MNALDWVAKWADYTPDKIALTSYDTDENYTYEAVNRYANRLKSVFLTLGVKAGDRVAVLAGHGLEYIIILCACQRMGAILVPLNYRLSAHELSRLISDCSPRLFIYDANKNYPLEQLQLQQFTTASIQRIKSYYKSYQKLTTGDDEIKENHPLFIFYTSGTTGAPKGVIYTNKMMFWNSLSTSMQLGITYNDTTINVLPPYHTSGWNVFITPLLHQGGHIGITEKFEPEKTLRLLERNETTLFIALPTMLYMMQRTSVFKTVHLEKLRYIVSGGEAISPELSFHWKKEKNVYIRPGYGLTEAGPGITSLHHKKVLLKPSSIGKPNFYIDLKIVDQQGKEVRGNAIGELCIKGNAVTPGYWNNSVKTKDKIKKGWLHTGDLACKDNDGYLYLKGRKDDMYISGGENIYPQEIEWFLEQLPDIRKAVVLSIKDKKWGACGIAFVTVTHRDVSVA